MNLHKRREYGVYRRIYSDCLNDGTLGNPELSNDAVLLALCLMFAKEAGILGCFRFYIQPFAKQRNRPIRSFKKAFKQLRETDLLIYDEDKDYILLSNYLRYNPIHTPNQGIAALNELDSIPSHAAIYPALIANLYLQLDDLPEVMHEEVTSLVEAHKARVMPYITNSSMDSPIQDQGSRYKDQGTRDKKQDQDQEDKNKILTSERSYAPGTDPDPDPEFLEEEESEEIPEEGDSESNDFQEENGGTNSWRQGEMDAHMRQLRKEHPDATFEELLAARMTQLMPERPGKPDLSKNEHFFALCKDLREILNGYKGQPPVAEVDLHAMVRWMFDIERSYWRDKLLEAQRPGARLAHNLPGIQDDYNSDSTWPHKPLKPVPAHLSIAAGYRDPHLEAVRARLAKEKAETR